MLETIFWIILATPALVFFATNALNINPHYDPKGNDPYRYCPKEEEM